MERVFKLFDKKGDRCIDEDRFILVLKVEQSKKASAAAGITARRRAEAFFSVPAQRITDSASAEVRVLRDRLGRIFFRVNWESSSENYSDGVIFLVC